MWQNLPHFTFQIDRFLPRGNNLQITRFNPITMEAMDTKILSEHRSKRKKNWMRR